MAESLLIECPNAATLATYATGALDEPSAESIVTHLQQCSDCRSHVDELLAGPDSLLDVLRQSAPSASEDGLAGMIRQAQQLRPLGASQPTRSASSDGTLATRQRRAAVDLPTFLSGLRSSRLLPRKQIDDLLAARRPRGSREFANELVERRLLTPFQARSLLRGAWKGLVLGNYVVLDKLGRGGMAHVFKARHRKMGRTVCLKVLPRSARRNREHLERFRREAQTIAALDHDNIVVGHDADEADGVLFLVMEYIDGRDLARIVREDGPLSIDEALDVIMQAARALDHAHRQGIIHRDIKPSNLMRVERRESRDQAREADSVHPSTSTPNPRPWTLKILDMGIARFDPILGENPDGISQATMTGTDIVMGTIDYMSPEQALNLRDADERSDIYSLGCTLFFLLTGKAPFGGTTMMEKLIAHREQRPPRLTDECTAASAGLGAVFARMVAKDPDRRFASMEELTDELMRLRTGARPRSQPIIPWEHRHSRRVLLAGGVLLTLLLAGGTWFVQRPKEPLTNSASPPPPPPAPEIVGHPATIANGGPGRVLLFVAADGFDSDHFTAMTTAMSERGIDWVVASSRSGTANAKDQTITVPIDVALPDVEFDPNDFDGVLFIGGHVVYEFGHKDAAAAGMVRRVLEHCLNNGRYAAGLGDGMDALFDSRLLDDAPAEQQNNIYVLRPAGRSGTVFKTMDCAHAAELVDALLAETGQPSP